jgi:hypothetical protein
MRVEAPRLGLSVNISTACAQGVGGPEIFAGAARVEAIEKFGSGGVFGEGAVENRRFPFREVGPSPDRQGYGFGQGVLEFGLWLELVKVRGEESGRGGIGFVIRENDLGAQAVLEVVAG